MRTITIIFPFCLNNYNDLVLSDALYFLLFLIIVLVLLFRVSPFLHPNNYPNPGFSFNDNRASINCLINPHKDSIIKNKKVRFLLFVIQIGLLLLFVSQIGFLGFLLSTSRSFLVAIFYFSVFLHILFLYVFLITVFYTLFFQ